MKQGNLDQVGEISLLKNLVITTKDGGQFEIVGTAPKLEDVDINLPASSPSDLGGKLDDLDMNAGFDVTVVLMAMAKFAQESKKTSRQLKSIGAEAKEAMLKEASSQLRAAATENFVASVIGSTISIAASTAGIVESLSSMGTQLKDGKIQEELKAYKMETAELENKELQAKLNEGVSTHEQDGWVHVDIDDEGLEKTSNDSELSKSVEVDVREGEFQKKLNQPAETKVTWGEDFGDKSEELVTRKNEAPPEKNPQVDDGRERDPLGGYIVRSDEAEVVVEKAQVKTEGENVEEKETIALEIEETEGKVEDKSKGVIVEENVQVIEEKDELLEELMQVDDDNMEERLAKLKGEDDSGVESPVEKEVKEDGDKKLQQTLASALMQKERAAKTAELELKAKQAENRGIITKYKHEVFENFLESATKIGEIATSSLKYDAELRKVASKDDEVKAEKIEKMSTTGKDKVDDAKDMIKFIRDKIAAIEASKAQTTQNILRV